MRLSFTPPLDASALRTWFAARAVAGIEALDGDVYSRSLRLRHGPGVVSVTLDAAAGALTADLALTDAGDADEAAALCRDLLDLDADPAAVSATLHDDPLLAGAVRAAPGRRVPGAVDATELCVRAVLGQQISLAGAATAAARLVARCGEPLPEALRRGAVTRLFPRAETLAALRADMLAMPRARGRSLVGVCDAIARGDVVLTRGGDPEAARAALLALPGIGPWTADYVVMRVLGDHDTFLAGDLGVRRALERAGLPGDPRAASALAQRWRPYRSYALQYLWSLSPPGG